MSKRNATSSIDQFILLEQRRDEREARFRQEQLQRDAEREERQAIRDARFLAALMALRQPVSPPSTPSPARAPMQPRSMSSAFAPFPSGSLQQ